MISDTKNLIDFLALQLEFHQRALQALTQYKRKRQEVKEMEHAFTQELSPDQQEKFACLQESRHYLEQMATNDAFLCGFYDGIRLKKAFDCDNFEKLRDDFLG